MTAGGAPGEEMERSPATSVGAPATEGVMTQRDAAGLSGNPELLTTMDWEPLPYGCVGLARHKEVRSNHVWSWLVLIPWAGNDSKPWIDGTKVFSSSLQKPAEQRAEVLQHMRDLLDQRYGESVGTRAAEAFLRKLRPGEE